MKGYQNIKPNEVELKKLYGLLSAAVSPRPIALVSSVDKDGNPNLSPFSFFNLFSINPPIVIFSPVTRIGDETTKDTLQNVIEHPEVTINLVSKDMVDQVSLASSDYKKGVNEFEKSGLTPLKSELVKPSCVLESAVSLECKVIEVKKLGNKGGAGNLVICEVLMIRIKDEVMNGTRIDTLMLNSVSRLGGSYYGLTTENALFELPKPNGIGVGFDKLPPEILSSTILSAANLSQLASYESLNNLTPSNGAFETIEAQHIAIKNALDQNDIRTAWQIVLK
tara:strand:- start:1427 stop:2266 length:840 start_codon:yes stop_codon:yes gene_type:complete